MPTFRTDAEFRFECESQEAVGAALRRLHEAAEGAGFELRRAEAVPAPDEDDEGWTGYVPLIEPKS